MVTEKMIEAAQKAAGRRHGLADDEMRKALEAAIAFDISDAERAMLHSADVKTAWAECEAFRVRVAELEAALSTDAEPVKPICHLVWLQGRRAVDDVEDYYEVARPGDKSVDGSDPFPVYATLPAPSVAVRALDADDVINELSAMPCETEGVEDLEVGCCRTCRARSIQSALSAQVQDVAILEGWQLVPKVLTPAMAAELNLTGTFADAAMQVRYAAALAKAPAAPTSKQGD